jgi:hypothetical protein
MAMRPAPPTGAGGTVRRHETITNQQRGMTGPTEAGRRRLSELAKARHAAGGFQKSADGKGRTAKPRQKKFTKRRVATMVAEAARDKRQAEQIIDVFRDAIHPTQPTHIRLKAAEAWLKIENEDAKLSMQESESESVKRDRVELIQVLSEKLTSGPSALLLQRQLEQQAEIIEADMVEVTIDGSAEEISG